MRRDTDNPSRQELTDRREKQSERMKDLHVELERKAEDLSTVRQLLEDLDLSGATAEGSELIRESVDRSEAVTEDLFDADDQELDAVHEDGNEYQNEVAERKSITESDLGRTVDDTASLETQETIDAIREAKEAEVQDVEFLQDLLGRSEKSLEDSQSVRETLRDMRQGGGVAR